MDLSCYADKKLAVLLRINNRDVVVRGQASHEHDETLGRVLRIQLDDAGQGNASITIQESRWAGTIQEDFEHGCDYQVDISSLEAAART